MPAVTDPIVSSRDALPVRLGPWLEKLYGPVSLLDIVTFDAGRLSHFAIFLALFKGSFGTSAAGTPLTLFAQVDPERRGKFCHQLKELIAYCEEASFPMAKIIAERALRLSEEAGELTLDGLASLLGNAMERLKDEAAAVMLVRIPAERVKYYTEHCPLDEVVFHGFPSVNYDAIEAYRCYALGRCSSCVFHLMRVLEIGLTAFAGEFGITATHTNWNTIIEAIEKAVRNIPNDPNKPADWKERQEFFSQAASHFMILKDAWRNYTAHARGKYTDEEAEMLIINVRSFMQRLSTRLHE